jgi:hypothetical protein
MEGRRKTGVLWAKAGVGFSLNEFQLEEQNDGREVERRGVG